MTSPQPRGNWRAQAHEAGHASRTDGGECSSLRSNPLRNTGKWAASMSDRRRIAQSGATVTRAVTATAGGWCVDPERCPTLRVASTCPCVTCESTSAARRPDAQFAGGAFGNYRHRRWHAGRDVPTAEMRERAVGSSRVCGPRVRLLPHCSAIRAVQRASVGLSYRSVATTTDALILHEGMLHLQPTVGYDS